MEFNLRKELFNRCNPFEALLPGDYRNLDMDRRGDETLHYVRGTNWVAMLADEIALSPDQPLFKLLSGHPGSGKTTELLRLAELLEDPEGENLLTVHINAEDFIDLHNPLEVTDLLVTILFSLETTVAKAMNRNVEDALEQGYFKRLWHWLCETEISLKKSEFTIPSAGKLVFEMKDRPSLRNLVRNTMSNLFAHFYSEICKELEALEQRVKKKLPKQGILFIFDSLEKLQGISTTWEEVSDSAERVFGIHARYLRLPFHTIYTVPASLVNRVKDVDFLPMIQVRTKTGEPYEEGVEVVRELIRRRIPDKYMVQIFGENFKNQIEDLVQLSGGYLRDILKLLRWTLNMKHYPLAEVEARKIVNRLKNQYREVITKEAFPWLGEVGKSKFMTPENDDQRRIAARMLANHVILRYLNHADESTWYDLHPAVQDIPGVQEAIKSPKSSTELES